MQSRYYDAKTGRFINSDSPLLIKNAKTGLNTNMCAYALNNCINNKDDLGYAAIAITVAGVAITSKTLIAILIILAAVVAIAFVGSYIFNNDFRITVNRLVENYRKGVIAGWTMVRLTLYWIGAKFLDSIGYLSNVISDVVAKAKKGRRYSGYELHHIVAQRAAAAEISRNIIKKYGLDVWHPCNLVNIKKTLHKCLHTNAYHAAVTLVLLSMVSNEYTYTNKKIAILTGLMFIGIMLRSASEMF